MAALAPALYVILYHLVQIILQSLLLLIGLDLLLFKLMFLANCLDLLLAYYLLIYMVNLIYVKLVMFYLLFLQIKSLDNFLIFLTN
jgi:hypothetical protein